MANNSLSSNVLALMFVDIANIGQIHEEVAPEAARDALAQWTSILRFSATQRAGFLVRKIGCSLLFTFVEADRAVDCAIAIQEMASPEVGEGTINPLFRIGIHAGDVGGLGAADAVKAAAQLTANAEPNQILVTEKTLELLSDHTLKMLRPAELPERRQGALSLDLDLFEVEWEGTEPAEDPGPAPAYDVADSQVIQGTLVFDQSQIRPRLVPEPPEALEEVADQVFRPAPAAPKPANATETSPLPRARKRLTLFWESETLYVDRDKTRITIGRELDNDIVLSVQTASRYHAVVEFVDGAFRLTDSSRNGTFLYGEDDTIAHVENETADLESVGAICPGSMREAEDCNVIFFKVTSRV